MKNVTQILQPDQLSLAAQLLFERKLVAFPTDTVYGLGTLAFDGPTALKLYVAKERPPEKAIPILIADIADLDQVATDVPPIAYRLMECFWPGALTLVVPKLASVPMEVWARSHKRLTKNGRVEPIPDAKALPQAMTKSNN